MPSQPEVHIRPHATHIYCCRKKMLKLLRKAATIRVTSLLSTVKTFYRSDRCNAHRAAISRIKRAKYVRQYYVTLLHPDGSTVGIRATEPMDLIQMPFNMDTLTDEERRHLEMKRHKIKKFTKKQETVKFNADEYIDLWRKNSKKP
uniref:39S ribosomal protein L55, mitochondrial n=1 Tax=Onchocerca volvulus TaxID=6282 RepID=A0A8R1Y975_ONCVO